jgi:hypothetical protein
VPTIYAASEAAELQASENMVNNLHGNFGESHKAYEDLIDHGS